MEGLGTRLLLYTKCVSMLYTFQPFFCFPLTGLQFRLTHDTEFDEIEYSPNPKSPGSEDILLNLPNYLQDNMFFGSDQATNFMEKLFKTVKG